MLASYYDQIVFQSHKIWAEWVTIEDHPEKPPQSKNSNHKLFFHSNVVLVAYDSSKIAIKKILNKLFSSKNEAFSEINLSLFGYVVKPMSKIASSITEGDISWSDGVQWKCTLYLRLLHTDQMLDKRDWS